MPNSPQDLQRKVLLYASQPAAAVLELKPDVRQVLKNWVGNDDGEAGHRAYRSIRHEIFGT